MGAFGYKMQAARHSAFPPLIGTHPSHFVWSITLAPVFGSGLIAALGQAGTHSGASHCKQTYPLALKSSVTGVTICVNDISGQTAPSVYNEQTAMQVRQPPQ